MLKLSIQVESEDWYWVLKLSQKIDIKTQLNNQFKWIEIEENSWIKFANVMNVIEVMNIYNAWNFNCSSKNSWITYMQESSNSEYKSEN